MRLLLDTHVFLWATAEPERLNPRTRRLLERRENELLLSAVSAWEIAIKFGLGKLTLPLPPAEYVPSRMALLGLAPLLIDHSHALKVAGLPAHHRDPFDRLLVAQAMLERVALVTADPLLKPYGIKIMWAN